MVHGMVIGVYLCMYGYNNNGDGVGGNKKPQVAGAWLKCISQHTRIHIIYIYIYKFLLFQPMVFFFHPRRLAVCLLLAILYERAIRILSIFQWQDKLNYRLVLRPPTTLATWRITQNEHDGGARRLENNFSKNFYTTGNP